MVGPLILSLLWLVCVHADAVKVSPTMSEEESSKMIDKMPMKMPTSMEMSAEASPMSKAKRYLTHEHQHQHQQHSSSPCPPFYPHFGMHMPMYAMRPYGPPSYPKNNEVHMPMYHQNHLQYQNYQHQHQHHEQHQQQFIHQPSYSSYISKQTIQYVKPQHHSPPVYQHPVHQPIHQPIAKQPSPHFYHYQNQPMLEHKVSYEKQPVFAYAPAYHKPMSQIWQPAPEMKKPNYNGIGQVLYHKPAIVYKPDPPKCAPCPPPIQHQPPMYHPHPHQQQPSISYVKLAQPAIHHAPARLYLPAPVHQPPMVKPCDK